MRLCSVAQLGLILYDPTDWSPPGSSLHGIPQAEILGGLPFPPPGDLPSPGSEPRSPTPLELTGRFFTAELAGEPKERGTQK